MKPKVLNRSASLDGLRGVAVLAVFATHLMGRYLPGGWVGVEIFFVLSGFLITSLLLREVETNGCINFRAFYIRRALRLTPALLVFVGITASISLVLPFDTTLGETLSALLYGMDIYEPVQQREGIFAPTWSLAVEEQFYLLWPFVLFLTLSSRRALIILLTTASLAGIAIGGVLAVSASPYVAYVTPFPHLVSLLGGASVALCSEAYWVARISRSRAIPVIACCMAVTTLFWVDQKSTWLYVGPLAVLSLIFSLFIAHIRLQPESISVRLLQFRPLAWLGLRSYGFYLWHFPAVWLAHDSLLAKPLSAGLALLVALGCTILSWRLVERPFLRLKDRWSVRSADLVVQR